MVKFSKDIREEIKSKYALKDVNGKRIYLQKDLAKEYNTSRRNIVVFTKGFKSVSEYYGYLAKENGYDSYSDYRDKLYLISKDLRLFKEKYDICSKRKNELCNFLLSLIL